MDEFEAREAREAEARERAKSDEQDLHNALRVILGTIEGKRVVFWLLGRAGLYSDPFSIDDAVERYKLGRRSLGLELLDKLNQTDARLYPSLIMDMAEAREMDRAAREAATRAKPTEDGDDQYA